MHLLPVSFSFPARDAHGASCWHTMGLEAVLGSLLSLAVLLCIPQLHRGCLHCKTLMVETKELELTDLSQRVQEETEMGAWTLEYRIE